MRDQRQPLWATIPVGVVLVTALGLIVWGYWSCSTMFQSTPATPEEEAENRKAFRKIQAWGRAEKFVKRDLRSPGSADFGSQTTEGVTEYANGYYLVEGWVDAQNVFGATIRKNFSLRLRCTENDRWELIEGPSFVPR